MSLSKLVPIFTAICLGAFSGAMLLIAASLMPYWGQLDPMAYRASFRLFSPHLRDVMLPLMFLSMLFAGLAIFVHEGSRAPWLLAFGLVILIAPLDSYLIKPVSDMILDSGGLGPQTIESLRDKWFLFHWIRTGVGLFAFIECLKGVQNDSHARGRERAHSESNINADAA